MGTPKSLSCNELLQLFSSRGMRIDEVDSLKIQHINYYKLKEFAEPFATYSDDGAINYNCVHFSTVLKRYQIEILSEKNLTYLANIYNCTNLELVSWLKCIHFIRNICAHNSNLIDIKLKTKPKLRSTWKERLFYDEKGGQEKPTNGASIVILIVMELVKMINSKYNWNRI